MQGGRNKAKTDVNSALSSGRGEKACSQVAMK